MKGRWSPTGAKVCTRQSSAAARLHLLRPCKRVWQARDSFPLFQPRIFADYCQYGVEPADEGVRLCCEPEIEARVYMLARSNGAVYESVRHLNIPVTVVRAQEAAPDAGMNWAASPTWPGLADEFPCGRDVYWPHCTHFVPMQEADAVIALIREEVAVWKDQV